MPAFAHDDVLDASLDHIKTNGTQVDVVSADCSAGWSNIATYSLGTFAYDFDNATLGDDGSTGRRLTVPEIAMGSVGVAGSLTTGHIVIHNGADTIYYQTTCGGSDITAGAAVTIATFNIDNPQPTVV